MNKLVPCAWLSSGALEAWRSLAYVDLSKILWANQNLGEGKGGNNWWKHGCFYWGVPGLPPKSTPMFEITIRCLKRLGAMHCSIALFVCMPISMSVQRACVCACVFVCVSVSLCACQGSCRCFCSGVCRLRLIRMSWRSEASVASWSTTATRTISSAATPIRFHSQRWRSSRDGRTPTKDSKKEQWLITRTIT